MLMYNFDLIVSDSDARLDLNHFFVWEISLEVNFNGIWQTVCQIVTVSGSSHSSKVDSSEGFHCLVLMSFTIKLFCILFQKPVISFPPFINLAFLKMKYVPSS